MASSIRIISSMATRQVLAELVAQFGTAFKTPVDVESAGGVDAARRVRSGEAFDIVVLAANAIDDLAAGGFIVAGSRVDLARSGVAVAVRSGSPRPALACEDDVRRAVEAAGSIAYSTGPSGTHLAGLFERWGIAANVEARLVRPPPGVPVAALIAAGTVELGFQQTSELLNVPGVDVVGPLPPAIQVLTIFAGGVASASTRADNARACLALLASPAAGAAKIRHGMEP